MSKATPRLTFNKGFNRSVTPFKADIDSCYELLNLRPARDGIGRLEQTPYFNANSYTARNYWNGSSSVTESSTGEIYGGWASGAGNVIFTRFTVSLGGTQLPVYYQTTCPAGSTDSTKGCRIVINSVSGLGLALGETLDIEIDGATTFKWRKSGGAYTTLVPITTQGVSIDSGNVTVYFLASSGFTVADVWSWMRTDSVTSPVTITVSGSQLISRTWGGDLFWLSFGGRVMRLLPSQSTGYAISAGYQPIYGLDLEIFYDHLFVANARVASTTYTRVVMNSDNIDIENFIPTDTNEADSKTLTETNHGEEQQYSGFVNFQFFIANNRLFAMIGNEIHATPYVGLPNVWAWDEVGKLSLGDRGNVQGRVAQGENVGYLIRGDGLWATNGTSHSFVGNPMGLTTDNQTTFTVVANCRDGEVVVFDSVLKLLWVYNYRTTYWYRRSVDIGTSTIVPNSVFFLGVQLTIGLSRVLQYCTEDIDYTGTPVKDASNGTAFTSPTVTSQLLSDGFWHTRKEATECYLLAQVTSPASMSSNYLTTTNVSIQLYWHASTDGKIGTMLTNSDAVWSTTKPDGRISYPRLEFRALALELRISTNDANKPPAGAAIIQLEPVLTSSNPIPFR